MLATFTHPAQASMNAVISCDLDTPPLPVEGAICESLPAKTFSCQVWFKLAPLEPRPVTQAGLLIGSAVTTGVAIAEFGQRFPEPGAELFAQLVPALQRDLIRSIPCQILDTMGDIAGHIGYWDSASGLYQAVLL